VEDVLPALMNKKPAEIRMDAYFMWPSVGDHRQRLQSAVRAWLSKHPDCCGARNIAWQTASPQVKFRMQETELAKARESFVRLRPGMNSADVLRLTGKPDAMDSGDLAPEVHGHIQLLGFSADDRNEKLAYIYFTERWADGPAWRDPLRDHYVIVFFSAQDNDDPDVIDRSRCSRDLPAQRRSVGAINVGRACQA
jgi:hypothetical protein